MFPFDFGIQSSSVWRWAGDLTSDVAGHPTLTSLKLLPCPSWSLGETLPPRRGRKEIVSSISKSVFVAQSFLTLCNPMDCSPSGSSVDGILQARILEWVAMPSSRGSSQLREPTEAFRIAGRFFTIWATKEDQEKVEVGRGSWSDNAFTQGTLCIKWVKHDFSVTIL